MPQITSGESVTIMNETATQTRVHNFSAGPAALPLPVLERAQRELLSYPGAGASVMEISHRSKAFEEVHQAAKTNIKALLNVPDSHEILFLQGGATLQFAMVAMNFLQGTDKTAEYLITGSWGAKAIKEADKLGATKTLFTDKENNFKRVPGPGDYTMSPDAAYLHFTSNETIQGVEFDVEPETAGVPLVCDASSNFLSKPIAIEKYGLLYAGAQKNVGPSGVTIVIIHKDLLERVPDGLPMLLDYKVMAEGDSLVNTPPCFGIYMVMLTTQWLRDDIGGLEAIHGINQRKANILYETIDNSGGFYRGHADVSSRSLMNVTWTLETPELDAEFIGEAKEHGLDALKGHRSVGGLRASIYNAVAEESVRALAAFMNDFRARKG